MNTTILEINDALNRNFETDTVIFTEEYSLLFIEDNPAREDFNKAIKIVNQFIEWGPNFGQAKNVSYEQFYNSLEQLK